VTVPLDGQVSKRDYIQNLVKGNHSDCPKIATASLGISSSGGSSNGVPSEQQKATSKDIDSGGGILSKNEEPKEVWKSFLAFTNYGIVKCNFWRAKTNFATTLHKTHFLLRSYPRSRLSPFPAPTEEDPERSFPYPLILISNIILPCQSLYLRDQRRRLIVEKESGLILLLNEPDILEIQSL